MKSRTAAHFNRVSKAASEILSLRNVVATDKHRDQMLVKHKVELDRVYKLIHDSADKGYIRLFLDNEDPIWENEAVVQELRQQGFIVNKTYHSHQGAIEWWHVNDKELE